jgi:hypothetical protein
MIVQEKISSASPCQRSHSPAKANKRRPFSSMPSLASKSSVVLPTPASPMTRVTRSQEFRMCVTAARWPRLSQSRRKGRFALPKGFSVPRPSREAVWGGRTAGAESSEGLAGGIAAARRRRRAVTGSSTVMRRLPARSGVASMVWAALALGRDRRLVARAGDTAGAN